MKNQSPCKKDCPNRCAMCHATCEAWKEYRAAKEADYAKRARYTQQMPDHPGKDSNTRRKAQRQQQGRE